MKKLIISALAVSGIVAGAAFAVEPALGAKLGTSVSAIETALAADGYQMTRFENENGRIEVYAIKDGTRHEIYIDPTTGEVTRLETVARRGPSPLPGIDDAALRAKLAADGYEIVKYERERGKIEVYATKGGKLYELKIDPRTGEILRIEGES